MIRRLLDRATRCSRQHKRWRCERNRWHPGVHVSSLGRPSQFEWPEGWR